MGTRGPLPKSQELRILTGSRGRRPDKKQGWHGLRRAMPSCPKHLSAEAKAEWKRIAPKLFKAGLLTLLDRSALAMYCQASADVMELSARIAKDGYLITVDVLSAGKGEKVGTKEIVNPAVRTLHQAAKRLHDFAAAFGATPASRPRVERAVIPADRPADDPLQALIDRSRACRAAAAATCKATSGS